MDLTRWFSSLSLTIAFVALVSTVWQAGRIARLTRNSHQIQVIADAFREIRSPGFLRHYRRILYFPPEELLEEGFDSLDDLRKESAYAVCYFFEHLGVLVARQLIPQDVLIATMRTLIIRSWVALEPAIDAEIATREQAYPAYMGHDFLPHFRQLVVLALSHSQEGRVTVPWFSVLAAASQRRRWARGERIRAGLQAGGEFGHDVGG